MFSAVALAYGQAPYSLLAYKGGFSGVTLDAAGDMFGTTIDLEGGGTVWELNASGTYKVLHTFGSPGDGAFPIAGVALDSSGNLYGAAFYGGANSGANGGSGGGMVWEITSTGTYKDLHDFGSGVDGYGPFAGLTVGAGGNLFGTTEYGGEADGGIVWEITAAGDYMDLHDFGVGSDGNGILGGVTLDSSGDLFGTTNGGGANFGGMVWELTASGTYKDLHDFGAETDGFGPDAGVTTGPTGGIFGTTEDGGVNGEGIVWEITAAGAYRDLHNFGSGVSDGSNPQAGVTFDSEGDLFGTTYGGGKNDEGTVWEISESGVYSDLHDFGSVSSGLSDGSWPTAPVTVDMAGDLFGATFSGGPESVGTVWQISQLVDLSLGPVYVVGGSNSTGTVTLASPAPEGGTLVTLAGGDEAATVPDSVTVPEGETSATFQVATVPSSVHVYVPIKAKLGFATRQADLSISATSPLRITLSPASVPGGANSTGTVTLDGPAPSAGLVVTLSSSSKDATVPSSVTVPAGETSSTFTISTTTYRTTVDAKIEASAGGVSRSAVLQITPPVLASLTLNPTYIESGRSSMATVTLSGPAPEGGEAVGIRSGSTDATVPESVTVPEGQTSASFTVSTMQSPKAYTVRITANAGGKSKSSVLDVMP